MLKHSSGRANHTLQRRAVILGSAALLIGPSLAAAPGSLFAEVWKDKGCPCCKDWVTHLEANGFKVKVNDTGNAPMRVKLGIHKKYGACHTALIGGYAIEGHVPSREILRLLHEKPNALGLATVPGMPVGAPGMDGPAYHGLKDPYSVMLLSKDGGATQYQKYEGKKT